MATKSRLNQGGDLKCIPENRARQAPTNSLHQPIGEPLFRDFRRREKRVTSLPDLTARARYPSSLISQRNCEPSSSRGTDKHSIGSTNEAFLAGSRMQPVDGASLHMCLQQVEMGPVAHPLFIASDAPGTWGIEIESIFCHKVHSGMEPRRTLRRRAFQVRLGGETCVCFDSGTEGNGYVCPYASHSKLPRETARPRPQFSPEVASNRAGLFGGCY